MSQPVSLRKYAEMRGCTPPAVRKAIAEGRILKAAVRKENGHWAIDPALADKEWNDYTDPAQQRDRDTLSDAGKAARGKEPEDADSGTDGADPERSRTAGRLAQSRAVKENYAARTARLVYERAAGKLCDADAVESEYFKMARTVRDTILNVAPRLAPLLATMQDEHEILMFLEEEYGMALEGLADAG